MSTRERKHAYTRLRRVKARHTLAAPFSNDGAGRGPVFDRAIRAEVEQNPLLQ